MLPAVRALRQSGRRRWPAAVLKSPTAGTDPSTIGPMSFVVSCHSLPLRRTNRGNGALIHIRSRTKAYPGEILFGVVHSSSRKIYHPSHLIHWYLVTTYSFRNTSARPSSSCSLAPTILPVSFRQCHLSFLFLFLSFPSISQSSAVPQSPITSKYRPDAYYAGFRKGGKISTRLSDSSLGGMKRRYRNANGTRLESRRPKCKENPRNPEKS